jgi:hypothetical protein
MQCEWLHECMHGCMCACVHGIHAVSRTRSQSSHHMNGCMCAVSRTRSQSSHHEYVHGWLHVCVCTRHSCSLTDSITVISPCGRQTHSTEVPASVLPPTQAERLTSTSTTHTLPTQQRAAPCQRPVGCARSKASPTCTCVNPARIQSVSQSVCIGSGH